MWLKKIFFRTFKVFFSRPVLTLLNLQGLDVRAGVIMIGISLFFKCGFNYKCQSAGHLVFGNHYRLPGMQTQGNIYAAIFQLGLR
jgi:hypothetical protein